MLTNFWSPSINVSVAGNSLHATYQELFRLETDLKTTAASWPETCFTSSWEGFKRSHALFQCVKFPALFWFYWPSKCRECLWTDPLRSPIPGLGLGAGMRWDWNHCNCTLHKSQMFLLNPISLIQQVPETTFIRTRNSGRSRQLL